MISTSPCNSIVSLSKCEEQAVPNQSICKSNVADLMDLFTQAWDGVDTFKLAEDSFCLNEFRDLLQSHVKQFTKNGVDKEVHFGYIDKFDLDPLEHPQIYMRADLHGDLKSLIENLRSLKEQGLLDGTFKCTPGVHLVFLGDYCDRGNFGAEILVMLMRLREENPNQVHLIRGNHEDTSVNRCFGFSEIHLVKGLAR